MKSGNKNQDKTYKRGRDTFEMHVDGMPSKKQKKQKVKMRQNGKKEIKEGLKD